MQCLNVPYPTFLKIHCHKKFEIIRQNKRLEVEIQSPTKANGNILKEASKKGKIGKSAYPKCLLNL